MKNDKLQLKEKLRQFKQQLCNEYSAEIHITTITTKLSHFIDSVLVELFDSNNLNKNYHFSLLALGSYGRQELLLHSDIDLLILHQPHVSAEELVNAQTFIQNCWDMGLEISHQLVDVNACAQIASQNLSVISSILDMRLLSGSKELMEELLYQTHSLHMWRSEEYYFAKELEQKKRYNKYGETGYNLEPNIKYGPGSLRDLHTVLSISQRHFGIKKLIEGISFGFITEKEYTELMHCQHFLWQVRFALHLLAGKAEERLSFDYQLKIAKLFNYQDKPHSLAIEQFMKDYFKVIKKNRELNEMLLQWFDETIIHHQKQKITPLDNDFQLSNNYIEVRHLRVFQNNPQSLLKLFLWIVKQPNIEGIRANTIRLIRHSLFLINKQFKKKTAITQTFMEILKNDNNPYEALQKMNRYGVLAQYIDCFAAVTGQMQYDLFHVFTVDQHTLFVIRNIARFTQLQYEREFPLCAKIMTTLKKPEVLYLAALFHDIAKGRGGDHSELGALEAEYFAKAHHMSEEDNNLLCWLVKYHLIMSQTAQRQDIYDPNTIKQFCQALPHPRYLDYLYLLTVADICGTNPRLWNAWKDSLLKELYQASKHRMRQQSIDDLTVVENRKEEALQLLQSNGFYHKEIIALWSQFKKRYFLHESAEIIAKHTEAILSYKSLPLVMILPHHSQGGTEIFIYMPHSDERFTITTSVLNNHHVSIHEALISTCDNGFDLDIYIVLDEQNQTILDSQHSLQIQEQLIHYLSNTSKHPPIKQKRRPKSLAHFTLNTQITYEDHSNMHTQLFLISKDRPGLLATLSRIFLSLNIHLHSAKIATAGERVEDMFYITNDQGTILSLEEKETLKQQIVKKLKQSS